MKSLGPRLARRVTLAALLAFCGALHAASSAPVVTLEGAADSSEVPYVAAPKFAASRASTGVAIHQIGDARLLDAVKEVGFSFVRTDLFWEEVQAPDGWRFDGLVSNLSARGLGALFILGYKHYMYSPDQPPTSAAQLAAFRNYVYQAAYRYRNAAVRFEVWNEQDHTPPSPRAYRALLETAVSAAHAANPDVTIATGGVQQVEREQVAYRTGRRERASVSPEISRDRARGLRRCARTSRRMPSRRKCGRPNGHTRASDTSMWPISPMVTRPKRAPGEVRGAALPDELDRAGRPHFVLRHAQ